MALRGRTRMMSDVDRTPDSSPDPLAISFTENTTTKSPRKNTPRRALMTTSPSKQNRGSSVSEFEFSSPSKAMIMNTPRMGSASPWRIKVTVQAEPGSDENERSPSVKRFTRTQTTTIPLKDPDAQVPVKRGRGRPRKSDVGATPKIKRAGTPIKRAARSESQEATAGAAESSAADVDTDAPPKRKRGRPRKSAKSPADDDTLMIFESEAYKLPSRATPTAPATSKSSTSQKSTRFASPQVSVPTIATTDATPQPPPSMLPTDVNQDEASLMLPEARRGRFMADYEMPLVDTPRQTDLAKQLRARKGTPHSKKMTTMSMSSDGESDMDSDVLTPTSGDEDAEHIDAAISNLLPRADIPPREEAPSESDQPLEDEDDELRDATNFAFDEGTTRMPDDTTIMDSENFSMISVASLPGRGSLISPADGEENVNVPQIDTIDQHTFLKPSMDNVPSTHSETIPRSSPAARSISSGLKLLEVSRPPLRRYKTPVVDATNPSAPPEIEPVQPVLQKPETPQLGRVVTAGVALQGLLDPTRLTPEPSQKVLDEKRNKLDDLFRGFSEGTRRDLQAGLRLGEQLAQEPNRHSPVVRSSPRKVQSEPDAAPVGRSQSAPSPRQPRLLTPEDQDDDAISPVVQPEVDDVHYPLLDVAGTERSLPSPARSEEDEMSWRVDTPPPAATRNTERMQFVSITHQRTESQGNSNEHATGGASAPAQEEDYSDIWQEEASRSSNTAETDDVLQVQDIFAPGPVVPARGKLPRTWRRESGNHFQYSDEAESPQQQTPPRAGVAQETAADTDVQEESEQDEDNSGASDSDDTGMFFQSNMPNVFSNRHSRDLKRRKADKLDLTLLMKEGESMVPESSPPAITKKSPPATKSNPFLNTPPRFMDYLSSPQKSSPLRRELRGSDISSESHSRTLDESSLPLVQSSPFHTYVEGQSKVSVASDQRQLFMEMEGVTDSSIRAVRNEADGYLDAYEAQERSLNEITEVTEPSRTWVKNTSIATLSSPDMKMLSPARKRVPLFRDSLEKSRGALYSAAESNVVPDSAIFDANKEASPSAQQHFDAALDLPQQRPAGFLARMTSSLWSAVTQPVAAAPPSAKMLPHPLMKQITPLPKIEPWTKTHYKTLDKLFNIQKTRPDLFSPCANPPTATSHINAHLLQKFLARNKNPYVGAVFTAMGYEFDMSEDMVVLCQVFCELLTLESIEAYEVRKGREIEMGEYYECETGKLIDGAEVARRLATVILGEHVREAEKEGMVVDYGRGLEVKWGE